MMPQMLMAGYGSYDPYLANVVLLMHMDGSNGSTTFIDQVGATVTAVGSAQISTAKSKFGGASGLFGTSSNWCTVPNSLLYRMGNQDFTMESWVYQTSLTGTQSILAHRDGGFTDAAFDWYITGGTSMVFALADNLGGGATYTVSTSISANVWNHMAVCRSGTTLRFFLNGVQQGTNKTTSPATFNNVAAQPVAIGNGQRAINTGIVGYLDDLRWTIGAARYTAAFTPPTEAFPNP